MRPSTSDYVEDVKDLLDSAIESFYITIYTANAFPESDPVEYRATILKAWQSACATRSEPVCWELSERMIRAV